MWFWQDDYYYLNLKLDSHAVLASGATLLRGGGNLFGFYVRVHGAQEVVNVHGRALHFARGWRRGLSRSGSGSAGRGRLGVRLRVADGRLDRLGRAHVGLLRRRRHHAAHEA